jgi:hypothetical protein
MQANAVGRGVWKHGFQCGIHRGGMKNFALGQRYLQPFSESSIDAEGFDLPHMKLLAFVQFHRDGRAVILIVERDSQRFGSVLPRLPKLAVLRFAVFGFTQSSFTDRSLLIWDALTEAVPRA